MRSDFTTELNNLHVRFAEMAMMVNEALKKAMTAFLNNDLTLAQAVIDNDQYINNREVDLEQKSFEMIALQQPVTSDLRMIVTILKASSDLERMGDHAVRIARTTLKLKNKNTVGQVKLQLEQLAQQVEVMFNQALDAYLTSDAKKAIVVAHQDEQINQLAHEIDHLCVAEMKANAQSIDDGTAYLLIATHLKRIGDYVTNLCEWVVYLQKGKICDLG